MHCSLRRGFLCFKRKDDQQIPSFTQYQAIQAGSHPIKPSIIHYIIVFILYITTLDCFVMQYDLIRWKLDNFSINNLN